MSNTESHDLAELLAAALAELPPGDNAALGRFRRALTKALPGAIAAARDEAIGRKDDTQAGDMNDSRKGVNTMPSKSFAPDVRATIRGFGARGQEIRRNRDLTAEGQAKQLKAIQGESDTYRAKAYDLLRLTWAGIRKDYTTWHEQAAAAEDAAAQAWDYQRLAYEAQAAKTAIKTADDFTEARRLYEQAIASGDRHHARAWLENAPEALAARFGALAGLDVNRITKHAAAALPQMLDTPELASLREQGTELTNRALDAYKATQEAGLFYDPSAGNPFSVQNEFARLLSGVKLDEKLNIETLESRFTLNITGDLPQAAERGEDAQARRQRLGIA